MRQIKLLRNIRMGIKTLLLHKLRSILTMLGVVFGVGSVVAMLAVGEGASKEALAQIRKLGSTNIIITSIKPAEEESGGTRSPFSVVMYGLLYDDQRRARECVAWFANQARDRGVVLYTIGLGAQADNELLAHAADITGGWYYFAPTSDELDELFENLYERIFLRLTD